MKRPLLEYWERLEVRGNTDYGKRLKSAMELDRLKREIDREVSRVIVPIVEWLAKLLKINSN